MSSNFQAMLKIVQDLLKPSKPNKMKYLSLCKIFSSQTYALTLKQYLTKSEINKLIGAMPTYISQIFQLKDVKSAGTNYDLREKTKILTHEVIGAIYNIIDFYQDIIPPPQKRIIEKCQNDFVRKIAELVNFAYVPITDLLACYDYSARIGEKTKYAPNLLTIGNPFTQIIDAAVKMYLTNQPPKLDLIENRELRERFKGAIFSTNNSDFIAQNISQIMKFIEYMPNKNQKKQLLQYAIDFVAVHNVRTLKSEGIQNLFQIMNKYNLVNKDVLFNIIPNLPTLLEENIKTTAKMSDQELLDKFNRIYTSDVVRLYEEAQTKEEKDTRQLVLDLYLKLFETHPHEFRTMEYNIDGLSKLVAPIFNDLSKPQIIKVLDMFGKHKVENYHPDFIVQLVNFANKLNYPELIQNEKQFVLELAEKWPTFLQNRVLLTNLLKIKKKFRIQEKEVLINVLSDNKIMSAELFDMYFQNLFLVKDAEQLKRHINNFIKRVAYLGYTDFKVDRLLKAFSLIYPELSKVQEETILDLLVLLAGSKNFNLKDMDNKTQKYVDKMLDVVEDRFSGKRVIQIPIDTNKKKKTVDVEFYDKITTTPKNYSKFLTADHDWIKNFRKIKYNLEKDERQKNYAEKSKKNQEDLSEEEETVVQVEDKEFLNDSQSPKKFFKFEEEEDEEITQGEAESLQPPQEEKKKLRTHGDSFVLIDETAPDQPKSIFAEESKNKKVYQKKYGEEIDTEDIKLAMLKRKKLQELNKVAQHLYIYADIHSNDVDLNTNTYIKAWSVLYYFRNKSLDSDLYDQAQEIQARNYASKKISHKIFDEMYNQVLNTVYKRNYYSQKMAFCSTTGWGVDFVVAKSKQTERKLGLLFLDHNNCAESSVKNKNQIEPLGIYKLIIKNLENAKNFKLVVISEREFNSASDKDDYIDKLISKNFMQMEK